MSGPDVLRQAAARARSSWPGYVGELVAMEMERGIAAFASDAWCSQDEWLECARAVLALPVSGEQPAEPVSRGSLLDMVTAMWGLGSASQRDRDVVEHVLNTVSEEFDVRRKP